ncbi:MAG: hypothetical protein WC498_03395 [Candidatus Saccharimonadales bacterium]
MAYLPPLNGGRVNATIGGNTAGAGTLISSGTMLLAGGNNVTLSQAGNALTISAANQTVQTQNLHNLTLSGNTAGVMAQVSSGTLTLAGGNNITLSQNGNAVTISGAAGGGGGGVAIIGSDATFTSGTVGLAAAGGAITIASSSSAAGGQSINFSVPATSSLAATGAVSIASAGNTISIGVPMFDAGISTGGNTSGTSGINSNGLVLAGGNNITLSQATNSNGATVTISGGGGGGANPVHSFYQNLVPQNSVAPYTTLAIPFRTMLIQPLSPIEGYGFPGDMTVSTLMIQMSATGTATSVVSASFGSTIRFGLYLLNNSSQLTLVNSVSTTWSAAANASNSTNWAGARFLTFHSSLWSSQPVLSYGERYWYGVLNDSAGLATSAVIPSWLGQYAGGSTQRSGTVGVSQVVNTTIGMVPFLGIYSTSLTSMPGSIGNSQINKVNVSAGFVPSIVLNATISAF